MEGKFYRGLYVGLAASLFCWAIGYVAIRWS